MGSSIGIARTPVKKSVLVTQPFMPPLEEFLPYLSTIWDSKWLTNGGQFHQQLEKELAEYLGVEYLSLFSNGTIALMVALQCLRISDEVITTPYSFVATAHFIDVEQHPARFRRRCAEHIQYGSLPD
jgi:dTDP-4-amino-4,6-dideoxygalactose transaminase